ncbi:ER lectin-like protein [Wolffia australiana]
MGNRHRKLTQLMRFLFLCSNFLLISSVFGQQSTPGAGLGRSSQEPRYTIKFHSTDSPYHPVEGQESMMMTRKEGQKYMCYLPLVDHVKVSTTGSEKRTKVKKPDEYLEPLKDRCIYFPEGWWIYELCHEKRVRQFHLQDDKVIQEFVLGEFDPELTLTSNQNLSDIDSINDSRYRNEPQRHYIHEFRNGTICDLTNQPRETEVKFVCGERGVAISSIKEVATCKYELIVQCSLICQHPMFQPEKPASHSIHCNEILQDKKEDEYDASKHINVVKLLHDDDDI